MGAFVFFGAVGASFQGQRALASEGRRFNGSGDISDAANFTGEGRGRGYSLSGLQRGTAYLEVEMLQKNEERRGSPTRQFWL